MVDAKSIAVSVCFATPDHQDVININVPQKCTVLEAINISGIISNYPQIDLSKNKVGVHAKLVELDQVLHEYDRVEIYRSLHIDPLQARRNRAARQND